jgi:hypothetical protein
MIFIGTYDIGEMIWIIGGRRKKSDAELLKTIDDQRLYSQILRGSHLSLQANLPSRLIARAEGISIICRNLFAVLSFRECS